ncbi:hypothetical protein IU494_30360 [Nocardia terpenica]|uniref:hypothetical protein n=1 Tax=Nocardia terpenica TaxID=455432 RepID=UPI001895B3D9|nr:hypothetical protein [Nocardia terpenica]MBF6064952.1 hypothetical protein [Nocardia terpenica]MBF6115224.1 hypothetical protein [Nocardia terpenica]MBF6122546.1 hypothetical protein [Nocardia terpenica]
MTSSTPSSAITETADPVHRCRQRRRCVARIRDDDDRWHGVGTDRPESLCRGCQQAAFTAIRQLYDDRCRLEAAKLAPPPRDRAPKVTRSGLSTVPIRLDIDTVQSAIEDETLTWANTLSRGEPLPRSRRDCVRRCVAILSSGLGTLIDLPRRPKWRMRPRPDGGDDLVRTGLDAVLGLAELHRYTQNTLGLTDTRIWLPDPCHVCGVKALTCSHDQEVVTCQACRSVWGKEEFARLNGVGILGVVA